MSNYQINPAFIPDDSEKKSDSRSSTLYTVELNDVLKEKPSTPYNPYHHRDVEHPTTNAETLLHLLKGSLGTGILAMPMAFFNAGYILGSIGTVLIGALCLYTIHMLISAGHEMCKRNHVPSMSYPAIAEAAMTVGPPVFKKCAKISVDIVNVFLLIYQLGACCVYVVFIAKNVKDVMDLYIGEHDLRLYMLVFLLPLILINWVRNLKYLVPFSTVANAITVISFGIIIYYMFHVGITLDDRVAVGHVESWPLFLGTVLFALEAIGVILPLENEMKTPKAFGSKCGVLNTGMTIIIALYVFVGLMGYLAYGNNIKDSITLNLEPKEVLAQIVKLTLAIAIFITHSLQCYVAIDIVWNEYVIKKLNKNNHLLLWEFTLRTLLVLITFLFAVAIPNLGMFISLIGAFCLSALGLAFPAIIDLSVYYYSFTGPKFKFLLIKNTILIVFSVFALIIGTYTSIAEIVREL